MAQRETDNDEVGAVPVIGPGQEDLDDENRNTLYLTYPCSEPNNYAVFEAKYMLAFSQSIISQRLAEFVPSNFIDRNDKPRVRRPMDPRGSGIESYGRIDLHCNVLGTAVCMPVTAYIVETEHFYDESLVHGSQGLGETDLILNGYIEIADYVESMQIARRALIDQVSDQLHLHNKADTR